MGKRSLAVVLVATMLGACGGTTHSQIDVEGKGRIYVGMSNDKLSEVMGGPDSVGRGEYGCPYSGKFFGFQPGAHTVEWAWKRPDGSVVVAYMDHGSVVQMGIIKPETKKVE